VIGARVFEHAKVDRLAAAAAVPVVNLLSDDAHPCQALADLLTVRRRFGAVEGRVLAYVGDFNNVARSLALAATMASMEVRLATPPAFGPRPADLDRIAATGASPSVLAHPEEAVDGADVVYTDVWVSMGQEQEGVSRKIAFDGFTVDDALMARAADDAVFLHCLPAHR